jgi:hypothetical protein
MNSDESSKTRERILRRLARNFFREVCSSVLDPYLGSHGFRRSGFGLDQLSYYRGKCALKFSYLPYVTDKQPRYAVTVTIGERRGWFRRSRRIGLWQVPSPDRGGNRWHWEFRGPEQLKSAMKKVVRLLDAHARPLWENESSLEAVLDKEWPIYLEMSNP